MCVAQEWGSEFTSLVPVEKLDVVECIDSPKKGGQEETGGFLGSRFH